MELGDELLINDYGSFAMGRKKQTQPKLFFFKISFRSCFKVDFSLAIKLNVFPLDNLPQTLN